MKNSAIIAVLKTLDKKECREFSKWLASPFFNQRQDVVDLFQYLTAAQHLEEEKFLAKERIYRKLFPNESYDDAKIRQTVHFLSKQLERYLAYQEIESNTYTFPLAYLKTIRKRKVSKVFQNKMNSLKRQGLSGKLMDINSLRHTFMLKDEYSNLLSSMDRTQDIKIQDSIAAFDVLFIAEKIKYAYHTLSHEKVFKTEYEHKFLAEVLNTIESDPSLLEYPTIAVYYYGYLLQKGGTTQTENHYFALKNTLQKYAHVISMDDQRAIYLIVLNYCIQKINSGAKPYYQETSDIYKEVISSKIIFENGILSRWTYKNSATIAINLKEYDWVENLVDNYTCYLNTPYQEAFSNFCLARLAFAKQDYSKAKTLLIHFESSDILLNLDAKILLLKMYYAQSELNALESLLESMKVYLRRKEVISYHKNLYLNTVKYTHKLVRLNPFDKSKRIALQEEITTASPLAERPWLLEQISKMG